VPVTDEKKEIERVSLESLRDNTPVEIHRKVIATNELLAVNELRRMLQRQAERDLVIEELRSIVDTLAVGQVTALDEIQKLKRAYGVLVIQQSEMKDRQERIAAVCDAFTKKLEEESATREKLAEELGDRD